MPHSGSAQAPSCSPDPGSASRSLQSRRYSSPGPVLLPPSRCLPRHPQRVFILRERRRDALVPIHRHHARPAARACPAPAREAPAQRRGRRQGHFSPVSIARLVRFFCHRPAACHRHSQRVCILGECRRYALRSVHRQAAGVALPEAGARPQSCSPHSASPSRSPRHSGGMAPRKALIVPPLACVIVKAYSFWVNVADTLFAPSIVRLQGLLCPRAGAGPGPKAVARIRRRRHGHLVIQVIWSRR